ncbi:MAG: hypothetical protein ACRD8O_14925 [Bryobacteraceae bacterium]
MTGNDDNHLHDFVDITTPREAAIGLSRLICHICGVERTDPPTQ